MAIEPNQEGLEQEPQVDDNLDQGGEEDPVIEENNQEEEEQDYTPFSTEGDEEEDKEVGKEPEANQQEEVDIEAEVNKRLAPIQKEKEVIEFLSSDKGRIYAPYRDKMIELAKAGLQDSQGRSLSVEGLAALAGGRNLVELGAQMEREARTEAGQTRTAPRSVAPKQSNGSVPDVSGMNSNDFNTLVEEVKQGNFTQD